MEQFYGIYPALVSPFDGEGELNTSVIQDLVDWHLGVGVDGFYVCGGTGEGLLLTLEERKLMTEATVKAVSGRGKVIVHVGEISTQAAVDLAQHAQANGADAISAIPPIYYPADRPALVEHYRLVAAAADLPLFVYHIPSNTGSTMTVDLMQALLEIPNVKGIKFSDYTHSLMRDLGMLAPDMVVYSGNDDVFLSGLIMGANGGIGLTYNFMPQLFVGIHRAFQSKDLSLAQQLQWKACDLIQTLLSVGGPPIASAKVAMRHLGYDVGLPRLPIRPLTEEESRIVTERLDELGLGNS